MEGDARSKNFLNERNYSVSMGMINREKLVQEIRKSCRPAGCISDQDDDRPGLPTLGTSDILNSIILCCGVVLCTVACLAASLVSTLLDANNTPSV